MDFLTTFNTIAALTGATITITEFVNRFWVLVDVAAQVRSLVIGIVLGLVGAGFNLGMFSDATWFGTQPWYLVGGLIGVMAGLVGNWSFATPLIQWVLAAFKITPPAVQAARKAKR